MEWRSQFPILRVAQIQVQCQIYQSHSAPIASRLSYHPQSIFAGLWHVVTHLYNFSLSCASCREPDMLRICTMGCQCQIYRIAIPIATSAAWNILDSIITCEYLWSKFPTDESPLWHVEAEPPTVVPGSYSCSRCTVFRWISWSQGLHEDGIFQHLLTSTIHVQKVDA
jgi:hypothetical protein